MICFRRLAIARNVSIGSQLMARRGLLLRMSSSLANTQAKQFKKSTLPSSFSKSEPVPDQSKTDEFANHMDDLRVTKCINPLVSDHNDLPLSLSITQRASSKLKELSEIEKNPDLALRVKVESGGCHGFQYDLKLADSYKNEFKPDEEDTMFVRDDIARVIIDKTSLEILRDSKVDYVNELIGSQFKVVDSPYTTSSCGCGSSFDFDFDKLAES